LRNAASAVAPQTISSGITLSLTNSRVNTNKKSDRKLLDVPLGLLINLREIKSAEGTSRPIDSGANL
jgi:hypothetical protein